MERKRATLHALRVYAALLSLRHDTFGVAAYIPGWLVPALNAAKRGAPR